MVSDTAGVRHRVCGESELKLFRGDAAKQFRSLKSAAADGV